TPTRGGAGGRRPGPRSTSERDGNVEPLPGRTRSGPPAATAGAAWALPAVAHASITAMASAAQADRAARMVDRGGRIVVQAGTPGRPLLAWCAPDPGPASHESSATARFSNWSGKPGRRPVRVRSPTGVGSAGLHSPA